MIHLIAKASSKLAIHLYLKEKAMLKIYLTFLFQIFYVGILEKFK